MPSTDTALPPAPELFSRWGALQTWWGRTNKEQAQIAEARLLSRLQFFSFKGVASTSADSSSTVARVGLVELSGKNRKINTLIIQQKPSASVNPSTTDTTDKDTEADDQGRTPIAQTTLDIHTSTDEHDGSMISPPAPGETAIVICHGYGAGLGFFYRNYHSLSQIPNAKIYAIDWLGMGGSSRPDFKFKHSSKTPVNDVVKQAEDFFISALEELREVQKIDKMILIGHSLGGYLSAVYALKYPERVEKLILASPGKLLFFSFNPGYFFFWFNTFANSCHFFNILCYPISRYSREPRGAEGTTPQPTRVVRIGIRRAIAQVCQHCTSTTFESLPETGDRCLGTQHYASVDYAAHWTFWSLTGCSLYLTAVRLLGSR